jgi:hypothetical protein
MNNVAKGSSLRVCARGAGFALVACSGVGLATSASGGGGDAPGTGPVITQAQITSITTLTGDTSDNTDAFDSGTVPATDCGAAAAPDEWYTLSITSSIAIDVDACVTGGTTYDSKIFILDSALSVVTCNDDGCGIGGPSALSNVMLSPGMYEVAIDGFASSSGPYAVRLQQFGVTPCFLDPACTGEPEGEPCDPIGNDVTNGGCNSTPNVFGSITVDGPPVCGIAWATGGGRDTDWYAFSIGSVQNVELEIRGEPDVVAFLATMSAGGACPVAGIPDGVAAFSGDCDRTNILGTGYVLNPGDYVVFAGCGTSTGGGIFEGFPCPDGSLTNNAYELFVRTDSVGACCFFPSGSCTDAQTSGDCFGAGGTFQGAGSICAEVKCPMPPSGACCLAGDECAVMTGADCLSAAGAYLGDGTGCGVMTCPPPGATQPGDCEVKISDTFGAFGGVLADSDRFGAAATTIGDLDGDGNVDMAVGAPGDDDGGTDRGAVWILFMNADGTVASESKISDTSGSFPGTLADGDAFGAAVAGTGDLDDDGVPDIVVGAPGSDEPAGLDDEGAVWILFMNVDGTVASTSKIANGSGGFGGSVSVDDFFGSSVEAIGDVDDNGVVDLAVGAPGRDINGAEGGAVWIIFLAANLEVLAEVEITEGQAGFAGALEGEGRFGAAVTGLGDVNLDGVEDIAVGEPLDENGLGACWILFLVADGTVSADQKISANLGGFDGAIQAGDELGSAVERLVDLDANGVNDLAVGAAGADAGTGQGAIWIIFMKTDGTVLAEVGIAEGEGGFTGDLDPGDRFGDALAMLADLDANGLPELAIGAPFDDDGGDDRGAVWLLCPNGLPNVALGPPSNFSAAGAGVFHVPANIDTTGIAPAGGGTIDLVAVIPNSDPKVNGVIQVFVAQIQSGGGFTGFVLPAPTYVVGLDPSGAAVGDFDGDGYRDVAVSNAGSDTVTILLNDGNDQGTLTVSDTVSGLSTPSAIVAADFIIDGGNAIDLAVSNAGNDTVVILENDGAGNFAPADVLPPLPVGKNPVALDPLDLDNDKDSDTVVVNESSDSVSALENLGDGTFVRADFAVGPGPVAISASDFDGDGASDFATVNNTDGTISVARNTGSGFDPALTFALTSNPVSIKAGDVTGDGLPDLVTIADDAVGTGRAVYAQANGFGVTGSISFSAPIAFDAIGDPNFVGVADFDSDGLPDVATVNSDEDPSSGSVTVFLSVIEEGSTCLADLSGNGVVDFADILLIIAVWGPCPGCPEDLDGSGDVGFGDILVVIGTWGPCP